MRRLLSILIVLAAVAAAQQSDPPLVFKTTTRLVQLDIVVTGKDGSPIRGLQGSDFTVLQDGKPQTISFFDAHAVASSPLRNPHHLHPTFSPMSRKTRAALVGRSSCSIC